MNSGHISIPIKSLQMMSKRGPSVSEEFYTIIVQCDFPNCAAAISWSNQRALAAAGPSFLAVYVFPGTAFRLGSHSRPRNWRPPVNIHLAYLISSLNENDGTERAKGHGPAVG